MPAIGRLWPSDNDENDDKDDNDDSDDNGGRSDGENDVNNCNGDADDLVQSVKILCGLTVKVKPPDASEQLLKVRVGKKTSPFFCNIMQDNDT